MGESRRSWIDIGQVYSFFEDMLFPLIEPLDNLYLSGGQVVEFVYQSFNLAFQL